MQDEHGSGGEGRGGPERSRPVLFLAGLVGAVAFPVVGVAVGIVLLVRRQAPAALVVLAVSALSTLVGAALLSA